MKEVTWFGTKEALGSSRPVRSLGEIVVQRCEALEFPRWKASESVMAKGQEAVAAFDAGAGALEDTSEPIGLIPDVHRSFWGHASKCPSGTEERAS